MFILSQSNSARILNMMKLHVSANSPYARKARIVIRELALEDRVEEQTVSSLEELKNIGISSYLDLLLHLPIRYQDRSTIQPLDQITNGVEVLIEGQIISSSITFRGRRALELLVEDKTSSIILRFFFF